MPKYVKDSDNVLRKVADKVLKKFENYKRFLEARVMFDFTFAYADVDEETEEKLGSAIMHHGHPADGVAHINSAKDRAMGRGDGNVMIDGDWWNEEGRTDDEREALMDHELYHFVLAEDKDGDLIKDNQGRPKLRMRKHDVQVGWFRLIASRHGHASGEVQQAKRLFDEQGQYFWPELAKLLPMPKSKAA